MPLTLDTDPPILVRIRHRCGDHLGTIVIVRDGHAWEAPVAFGAYRVIPDYRALAADALARACPTGALVRVRAAAGLGGSGEEAELPTVEVVISTDGGTLGEALVRRGWAVPDAQALAHQRSNGYWQALLEARAQRDGIWGETGVTASALGIPDAAALATTPSPHPPALWNATAVVVLLAALVLVAARRDQGGAVRNPAPQRRGLSGAALRLAAFAFGVVWGTAHAPRRRP